MNAGPTRRAMIAAPAAIVAASALSLPASAGGTVSTDGKWAKARAAYIAARDASLAYDAANIDPHVPDALPIGPQRNAAVDSIPAAVWDESERLSFLMLNAEAALLATPAPDASAFTFKYLVRHGGDQSEGGRLAETMEAEARRFSGEAAA